METCPASGSATLRALALVLSLRVVGASTSPGAALEQRTCAATTAGMQWSRA